MLRSVFAEVDQTTPTVTALKSSLGSSFAAYKSHRLDS